jgi:diazepam-binding inhibitor (GABA receptor modulator, acyl-CoA-binding protein)
MKSLSLLCIISLVVSLICHHTMAAATTGNLTSNEAFNLAVKAVNEFKSKPSNDELLKLYGLFKQSTVGNCNTDRPGAFDFTGKAKWDSWKGFEGTNDFDIFRYLKGGSAKAIH